MFSAVKGQVVVHSKTAMHSGLDKAYWTSGIARQIPKEVIGFRKKT